MNECSVKLSIVANLSVKDTYLRNDSYSNVVCDIIKRQKVLKNMSGFVQKGRGGGEQPFFGPF